MYKTTKKEVKRTDKLCVFDPKCTQFPIGAIVFYQTEYIHHVGIVVGHSEERIPMVAHATFNKYGANGKLKIHYLGVKVGAKVNAFVVVKNTDEREALQIAYLARNLEQRNIVYNHDAYNALEQQLIFYREKYGKNKIVNHVKKASRKIFKKIDESVADARVLTPIAKSCLFASKEHPPISSKGFHCSQFVSLVLQMRDVLYDDMLIRENENFNCASRKYGIFGKNNKDETKVNPLNLFKHDQDTLFEKIDHLFFLPYHGKTMDPASLFDAMKKPPGGGGGDGGGGKWEVSTYFHATESSDVENYLDLANFNPPSELREKVNRNTRIPFTINEIKTCIKSLKGVEPDFKPSPPLQHQLLHKAIKDHFHEQLSEKISALINDSSRSVQYKRARTK